MAIAAQPLHLYLPKTADASSRNVFLVSVPILFSERRTRHNRTRDETRSNAGGRSLKSSKIAGPTHYFRVFKIEYQILAQRSRSGDLRWPA